MQNFKPYVVVEDANSSLHLSDAGWRKNLHFFVFRILPFLFVLEAVLVFILARQQSELPPQAFLFIFLVTLIPAAILITRKYVTELSLTPLSVELTRNALRGREQNIIPVTDIDHILCLKRRGKGGGYFYYLVLKNGKRERFLRFPLFGMSEEKSRFINNTFARITGLPVQL